MLIMTHSILMLLLLGALATKGDSQCGIYEPDDLVRLAFQELAGSSWTPHPFYGIKATGQTPLGIPLESEWEGAVGGTVKASVQEILGIIRGTCCPSTRPG
jgi:hypothetical protein